MGRFAAGLLAPLAWLAACASPPAPAPTLAELEAARAERPADPGSVAALAAAYQAAERYGDAEALYQELLATAGAADPQWRAQALGALGWLAQVRRAFDEAEALHADALAVSEANGLDRIAAEQLKHLAVLTLRGDDMVEGCALMRRSHALMRRHGSGVDRRRSDDRMATTQCDEPDAVLQLRDAFTRLERAETPSERAHAIAVLDRWIALVGRRHGANEWLWLPALPGYAREALHEGRFAAAESAARLHAGLTEDEPSESRIRSVLVASLIMQERVEEANALLRTDMREWRYGHYKGVREAPNAVYADLFETLRAAGYAHPSFDETLARLEKETGEPVN